MSFVVYKITNKETGKCYIGATGNLKSRWKLQEKKFNPKNHIFKILAEYSSIEELREAEKYWIWHYDSIKKGYNKGKGGRGVCQRNKSSGGIICINDIVKSKLDKFKTDSGSKTYSDAINLLLSEYYPFKKIREDIKNERKT